MKRERCKKRSTLDTSYDKDCSLSRRLCVPSTCSQFQHAAENTNQNIRVYAPLMRLVDDDDRVLCEQKNLS